MTTVNKDTFHKWTATGAVLVSLALGGLTYFVQAEDSQTRLTLQNQINILHNQQLVTNKVNELVFKIDKQLTSIEAQLAHNEVLVDEVRQLRLEVNDLKIQLARNQL